MSALMTPRPARRRRTRPAPAPGGQPALFGAGAAPAAPAAPEPHSAPAEPAASAATVTSPETDTTARAHRHGPTLDDLVAGAWEGLLAGAPADCLVCGTPLAPRQSAGAGIVGGRCGGCGTTVS
jgi:hypothetical protein